MEPSVDPVEPDRRAAAVNDLLRQIGLTPPGQTRWWNRVAHDELGGRTATQAWLAGDIDDVKTLIEEWYAASERGAHAACSDPPRVDHIRGQLARLEKRTANRRLPTA
jgi:hypothetical protein